MTPSTAWTPLVLALAFGPALAVDAENTLYRCRGSDGVTSYQQSPCSAGQTDAGRIQYDPNESLPRAGAVPPSAPPPAPPPPPSSAEAPADEGGPEAGESPRGSPAEAPPAQAPPAAQFSGRPSVDEPASDAVECLRPDSSTYVRSGECDISRIGGGTVEGYVIDAESGERVWTETVVPVREIRDPARALGRVEACELARLHIAQIDAGRSPGGVFLRDAERVRDRHCD